MCTGSKRALHAQAGIYGWQLFSALLLILRGKQQVIVLSQNLIIYFVNCGLASHSPQHAWPQYCLRTHMAGICREMSMTLTKHF